ncbi:hypothetical protein QFC21_006081 [Naganishia friedmannii]|uniref:Uncharacterized protein n=1 Tax=Naganishia friedmannii TaxID=89922 RepID=A0ACC2V4F5_9TREE|nr:hypothetical protein QFC21_006081 [Naganishia friedmannii]
MAWRLADPYGVQQQAYPFPGQGNWWDQSQPGIGVAGTGDDVPYAGSPLSAGFGRGLFGGSSMQQRLPQPQPVQYQQQQQQQPITGNDPAETTADRTVPEISYQSVLNCFTLSYLNSQPQNKQLLIRLLPELPITPGVHSRDPTLPPTGPSGSNATGHTQSRDRGERNRFRSVAEAEQYRANQLAKKVGVDPRFDWDAFPSTVGWRIREQARADDDAMQGGRRSRSQDRDGDSSAGMDDELVDLYSPENLQLDDPSSFGESSRTSNNNNASDNEGDATPRSRRRRLSAEDLQRIQASAEESRRREQRDRSANDQSSGPSPPNGDDDHHMQQQDADSAPRHRRTSGGSVSPTTRSSKTLPLPGPPKSVKFARHLELARTAPTIISQWGPYCIWAESEDVIARREDAKEALRAKEERDAMYDVGFGLSSGGKSAGVDKSKYNPKSRSGGTSSSHYGAPQQSATSTRDIPVTSEWLAPAVTFPLSAFVGLGFAYSSSFSAITNNKGKTNGTSNVHTTSVMTRAACEPAHKAKQPVKPALSEVVCRWRARKRWRAQEMLERAGQAVGNAARSALKWVRNASVGASSAITSPVDDVAERASVNAESSVAGARRARGEREQESRVQTSTTESRSAAIPSTTTTSTPEPTRVRSSERHSERPSMHSLAESPARSDDRHGEQARSSTRARLRYERERAERSDAEADGDRFYRAPVSRQQESSSSEDGFDALSVRQNGKRHRERDMGNDRGRKLHRVEESRRSGSWSSAESRSPDRNPRSKTTTIVLDSTRDRHVDGALPRALAEQDVLDVYPADTQDYDNYGDDEYEQDLAPVIDLPAIGSAAAKPVTRDNTAFNAAEADFVPLEDDKMDKDHIGAPGRVAGNTVERANRRWQSGYSDMNAYFRSLSSLSDDRGRRRDRYASVTAGDSWVNDESDTDSEDERQRSGRVRLRSPPPGPSLDRKVKAEREAGGKDTAKQSERGTAAKPELIDDEDMDEADEKILHSWEARLHATLQTYTKRYEVPEYDDETNSEDENPDFAGIEEDSDAEMRVEAEEVPELGVKPMYGSGYNKDRTLPKFARHKVEDFEERNRRRGRGNQHRYDGNTRYQPYRRR